MKIPNEIKEFFGKVKFMSFATVDSNGMPNNVAIGSKKIVDDDTIWVIDTYFGKTKENILDNGKVAIMFMEYPDAYQIKGIAKYHSEGEVFEKGKEWILQIKPKKIVKGVVEIKVTDIFLVTSGYDTAGKRVE